jgi:hypothetical protein
VRLAAAAAMARLLCCAAQVLLLLLLLQEGLMVGLQLADPRLTGNVRYGSLIQAESVLLDQPQ